MIRRVVTLAGALLAWLGGRTLANGPGGGPPAAPPAPSASIAATGAPSAQAPTADPRPPKWTIPLSLHVAEEAGRPTCDDAWIDAQISEAQHQYAHLGLAFRRAKTTKLAAKHAALETRTDRDALKAHLSRGVLDVFLVRLLRDVDTPPHEIHGVHWRPKGDEKKHYVIVSSIAGATTLAHELGHYFGLPHSKTPNNLMSYDRSSGRPPFLDEAQGKTVLVHLGLSLRTKELVASP